MGGRDQALPTPPPCPQTQDSPLNAPSPGSLLPPPPHAQSSSPGWALPPPTPHFPGLLPHSPPHTPIPSFTQPHLHTQALRFPATHVLICSKMSK